MIKYNGVRRLGGGGGSVIDVTVYLKLYARPVAVKLEEIHPNFFTAVTRSRLRLYGHLSETSSLCSRRSYELLQLGHGAIL